MNYFGYFVYDQNHGLGSFFGAFMEARRFLGTLGKQSLFVIQARFERYQDVFCNKADGKPKINPEF